jgi:hypothetical protein
MAAPHPHILICPCTGSLISACLPFQSLDNSNPRNNSHPMSLLHFLTHPETLYFLITYPHSCRHCSSLNIYHHEATHGHRHRHSHLLQPHHSLRPVHRYTLLEVWLAHGMLHDHGFHDQYVHPLFLFSNLSRADLLLQYDSPAAPYSYLSKRT